MTSCHGFIKYTVEVFTIDEDQQESRGEKEIVVVAPIQEKLDVRTQTHFCLCMLTILTMACQILTASFGYLGTFAGAPAYSFINYCRPAIANHLSMCMANGVLIETTGDSVQCCNRRCGRPPARSNVLLFTLALFRNSHSVRISNPQ